MTRKGEHPTDETRLKISLAKRGRKINRTYTSEQRAKTGAWVSAFRQTPRGRQISAENGRKAGLKSKGRPKTPETIERMRAGQIARWAAQVSLANTRARKTEQARAKRLIAYRCALCRRVRWKGQLLRLHLDHVDGDHHNRQESNLRWLCPNCHDIQPTSRVRASCGRSDCYRRVNARRMGTRGNSPNGV